MKKKDVLLKSASEFSPEKSVLYNSFPDSSPTIVKLSILPEREDICGWRSLPCQAHILSSPHVVLLLISCREWLPQHVPRGNTSRESSWRSHLEGSRFTVKDRGWVGCQAASRLVTSCIWRSHLSTFEGAAAESNDRLNANLVKLNSLLMEMWPIRPL